MTTKIEYGVKHEKGILPAPNYLGDYDIDPLDWVIRISKVEGGVVVCRTTTVSEWKTLRTF